MNFRFIMAASALVAASSMAQAQVTIQTSTVDLTGIRELSYYDSDFTLLSDQNGVVRFSLNNLAREQFGTSNYENGDFLFESFNIHLHDGFRLNGFELTGTYTGQTLTTGGGGVATNSVSLSADLVEQPFGTPYASVSGSANNVNGSRPLALGFGRLTLTGDKILHIQSAFNVYAAPGYSCGFDYGCTEMPSYAAIAIKNPVLTLHTQAVPEPETYALMLAGLAGVGWVARRKKAISVK